MGIYQLQVSFARPYIFHKAPYVNAMESRPPPAPDSACATLSLCCSAEAMACAGGEWLDQMGLFASELEELSRAGILKTP